MFSNQWHRRGEW